MRYKVNINNCYTSIVLIHPSKFKLRGATNKIIWCNHKRGQVKVTTGAWNQETFMVEIKALSNKHV